MIPVVLENCAGVDVHRDLAMVCWMSGAADQEARWETRKFGTTVGDLLQLEAGAGRAAKGAERAGAKAPAGNGPEGDAGDPGQPAGSEESAWP